MTSLAISTAARCLVKSPLEAGKCLSSLPKKEAVGANFHNAKWNSKSHGHNFSSRSSHLVLAANNSNVMTQNDPSSPERSLNGMNAEILSAKVEIRQGDENSFDSSEQEQSDFDEANSSDTKPESSSDPRPDELVERGRMVAAKIQQKLNQKRENQKSNVTSVQSAKNSSNTQAYVQNSGENAECYEPKIGDIVLGMVRIGTPQFAELDIGAARLARLPNIESKPLNHFDNAYYDVIEPNQIQSTSELPITRGKPSFVVENAGEKEECLKGLPKDKNPISFPVGTMLSVEIVGETIQGQPLVSLKRLALRIAWWRAQQIMESKEAVKVEILSANSGGFVVYFEGIRAFLPIGYVEDRDGGKPIPKNLVGEVIRVMVVECNRNKNRLILSEKAIKEKQYKSLIKVGNLVEGKVEKIFDQYAIIQISNCFYRAILHISNVSFLRIEKIDDVLTLNETYKFLIVDANNARISLSTKYFEVEDGLILQDLERVMNDAESMAEKWRSERNLVLDFEEEEEAVFSDDETDPSLLYSPCNLKYFEFPQSPLM